MGLESFNELRRRDPLSLGAEGLAPSMAALVEQPEEQLRTAVEWCHRRQVFQSLVDGSYKTVQQEFDVKGLLERLVRNDGEVVVVGLTRHAAADRTMLAIILEEVLSNCRKYRQPSTPITLSARIGDGKLLIEIGNVNRMGVRKLSDEECVRVFEPGFKGQQATSTSSGIGLDTVMKAVQAAHGRVWMSTEESFDSPGTASSPVSMTTCHIEVPAEELPEGHATTPSTLLPGEQAARMAAAPEAAASDAGGGGAAASDAGGGGAGRPIELALGIDDDQFMRDMHLMIFEHHLDVGKFKSLGASDEEIDAFVDCAMGIRDLDTLAPIEEEEGEPRQVDVLILDQNIDRPGGGSPVLGTDLAAALHKRSFKGVVGIVTASGKNEIEEISRRPGVDFAVEKGTRLGKLTQTVQECWEAKQRGRSFIVEGVEGAAAAPSGAIIDGLVDLSQLSSLPPSAVRKLLVPFFDPAQPASADRLLASYERDLNAGKASISTHRLVGGAKTAGAVELARLAEAWEARPSVEGLNGLRLALDRARAVLRQHGLLNANEEMEVV